MSAPAVHWQGLLDEVIREERLVGIHVGSAMSGEDTDRLVRQHTGAGQVGRRVVRITVLVTPPAFVSTME